jgi:hypothetical protein
MTLSLASYKQNGNEPNNEVTWTSKRKLATKMILLIPLPNACLPSLASFS